MYRNGLHLDYDLPSEPSLEQLKEWIECEWTEIVRVWHQGRYEQLIVDEEGRLMNKKHNPYATEIYLENARLHHPNLYLKAKFTNDADIVGTAVLLTGENKLT